MPVYKDKSRNTWTVMCWHSTWQGERKQKCKRGFATKREAQEWEREFLLQKQADVTMTLDSFYTLYERDMKQKLKLNTWMTKEVVIKKKILPYLGKRKLSEITPQDIIEWQNEIRKMTYGPKKKPYSQNYLKEVHTQLSAMFNHAVKFYGLRDNPAAKAGSMGRDESKEQLFWTKEEYLKFSEVMMDKPQSYYAFQILYWTGIRMGELLALTPKDFDFEANTMRINKSYQRLNGEDVITDPKTKKGIRTIKLSPSLCEEIKDYISMFYNIGENDRMFTFSRNFLHHEMERGCKESGVKKIRVHDLRHSHISLLIDMGFSALAIGERVGHEAINITYNYAHLFPTTQTQMAERLEMEWENE